MAKSDSLKQEKEPKSWFITFYKFSLTEAELQNKIEEEKRQKLEAEAAEKARLEREHQEEIELQQQADKIREEQSNIIRQINLLLGGGNHLVMCGWFREQNYYVSN